MRIARGCLVSTVILLLISGATLAQGSIVVQSNPPGMCTMTFNGILSNLRVEDGVSMCDSLLYARPGETVHFIGTVTNIYSIEPGCYFVTDGGGFAYNPPAPPINVRCDEFPVARPGESFDNVMADVAIPLDTPIGSSFSYNGAICGAIVNSDGTKMWNRKTNAWDTRVSAPYWSNYVFGMGRVWYTIDVVPEPSSIVAILTGLAGVGGMVLRKKH